MERDDSLRVVPRTRTIRDESDGRYMVMHITESASDIHIVASFLISMPYAEKLTRIVRALTER